MVDTMTPLEGLALMICIFVTAAGITVGTVWTWHKLGELVEEFNADDGLDDPA